ncbi:hypothetical protein SCLCIDRAFT_106824 [Scleroderma citrinum Foug A]|uniref:DUF1742-domain-containing protein n=1 Tax=Scleroderma citrinum Foug A TaxID=1036808 RepID=A0A0C3EHU3_9AGAM|nr:hypothetical protein SCLCIDRAFT_106824 [Scleroderma citrinum Foug A]
MSFPNLYYKRTVATAKSCFICYKPTTTVLATIDTTDFLYTCPVHLTDPGFTTCVNEPDTKKASPSAEEIAKVKQEWEEKQKKKKETEKEKDKDKDKDKLPEETTQESRAATAASGQSTPAPTPTHERYVLHRNIFSLRVAEHRRRRQAAQAKTLAPRLPGTPTNTIR